MARNLIKNLQRRQARQAADEAAKQLVLERWEQFCTKADIAILYTLWNDFGFGKAHLPHRLTQKGFNFAAQFAVTANIQHKLPRHFVLLVF